jgi:CheY-like chemotaxis protein
VRGTPSSEARAPSALEAPARRKKILLVDDSMTALMMNRMLLSKCGCDIVTARDGREAVQKALAERPDLIIMDIVMPTMNGFEACQRLRTMQTMSKTPILLVTTRGEAESIATGFASGCTDYVTKPVNSVELLSKIKAYLGE